MFETVINIILSITVIYLLAGILFSILFLGIGIQVTDEGAHGTGIGFKLIILPGCIIFWPLLLRKWIKAKKVITKN
jgi:hypothetical protein